MKFKGIMERVSAIDQLLYPEGLGVMLFVNSPFIFRGPWALISGMMTEATRDKIKVIGAEYAETLNAIVGPELLPDFLGGTVDPKHMSGLDIKTTPWFDEMDAHIAANAKTPAARAEAAFPRSTTCARAVVSRSDSHTISQRVEAGETCRWEWELEAYDLGFSVIVFT